MKFGSFSGPYTVKYWKGAQTAKEVIDWDLQLVKWADEYGLDEAYFTEHHTVGTEPSPAPDLMIAAASQVTSNITLGAMGHLIPYHNPAALAHRLMWLDHMTGGRYIAGVAPGAFPTDAQVYGTGKNNAEMLYDGLEVITAIWTQEPPYKVEGKYFSVDVPAFNELWHGPHLKPFQTPHPRFAIAGNSARSQGHMEAGKRGWIMVSQQSSVATLRSHWDTYSEAAESAGRTPRREDWRILRDVFVADTDEQARERVLQGGHGIFWREHLLPLFKAFGLAEALADPGMSADDITLEWLVDEFFLVGSPETVERKIRKLWDETGGFGALVSSVHDYTDQPDHMRRSLELLGTDVKTRVKDLIAR